MTALDSVLLLSLLAADPLGPGDHNRTLMVGELERSYIVHVPPKHKQDTPTPVVLVYHGGGSNAEFMVQFSGMNTKADDAGFIAVYPNGTGLGPFLTWNAGGRTGKLAEDSADDVKYVGLLLDDLATVANVDSRRVYATGMSNGGMMCYRLAAEMSDRIAAIAPVAGTVTVDESKPERPVPVMHFHGRADTIVPFDGLGENAPKFLPFKSVEESIAIWCQIDKCPAAPTITEFPDKEEDGTTVRRRCYGPGKNGAEVVLIEIEGGGHTWPGRKSPIEFLGKSTLDISANNLIWEFFEKHPMK